MFYLMVEESLNSLETPVAKEAWRCIHDSGQGWFSHFTVSLHPWPWGNEWHLHVLCTASSFSKQYIDRFVAQWHTIISCKSESLLPPLHFSLWSRVLSSSFRFRISRLACSSHRASPPAASYFGWGPGLLLDFSGCYTLWQKDSANCSLSQLCTPTREITNPVESQMLSLLLQKPSP